MKELTLRELCEMYDVSRRAVQGYEKHGLVSATGRTNKGYLLYDESAQQTVARIKRYQDYGFSVKEIGTFFNSTPQAQKELLVEKLNELKAKKVNTEKCIDEVEKILEKMYSCKVEKMP